MNITAADVMKLRKMTSAGMMDCKKALIEAEGDFTGTLPKVRLRHAYRAERPSSYALVAKQTLFPRMRNSRHLQTLSQMQQSLLLLLTSRVSSDAPWQTAAL